VDVSPVGLGENHLCGGNEHRAPLDPVLTAKEWNNSKSDVARCYRPNSLTTTVVRSARIFEDRVDSATSLKTS
jgi:hypothetical protein